MKTHIIFIHGAGKGAYKEDNNLVENLKQHLGSEYEIHYPAMIDEDNAPYNLWKNQIIKEIENINGNLILIGHSVGGSIITKLLSEEAVTLNPIGIFLISTPFWGGDGWKYDGYQELELPNSIDSKYPKDIRTYLYHCKDDEVVPFNHLDLYSKVIPNSKIREVEEGGHQLSNDLSIVATDVQNLV